MVVKRGGCEGIVGIEEVKLAETFLKKEEEVSMTGYEWYSKNRDGDK